MEALARTAEREARLQAREEAVLVREQKLAHAEEERRLKDQQLAHFQSVFNEEQQRH